MQIQISQNFLLEGKLYFGVQPLVSALSLYLEKKKQRKDLLQLDDHLLDDIGITRAQAIEEARR